ncbi:ATP-grasp domain-containing protein [Rhodanobacter sp. AS-Z3]|uniref:ATP-grasp domain-containing protein n=1 Tax=Rhodanobacter sp. AS-Z3 TaxID=3031330 RepID=UPI002479F7E1|nr:ATP-grasp domain-containing protein [Rhodanobacter sp. AS-Z3]WEN16355.1 ATP-grasp domain-containing protein [Rhodanobacter sp. AS-Z3]
MPNVLILGGRAPAALDHARRFAHQGWAVTIGDSIACRISGWSRAVTRTVVLPSARFAPRAYVDALCQAIREHQIELVVPTCEEVFYLSRYRAALPATVRVAVGNFETMDALHSKWRFLEAAQGCGAVVPESACVDTLEQARHWAGTDAVILKPEYSRFGVHVRLCPDGIPAQAKPFELAGRWVVQRFCHGHERCSYSIVDRGRLLAHVSYRPGYRLKASSSFLFETHESPRIRDFVERFASKMNYTGQLSFDWIESENGDLHVLECNPRAISGIHLFGMDDAVPAALTGTATTCATPSCSEPRMITAVMLGAGGAQALRTGQLRPWWRDLQRARDVIVVPGDSWPLLGGLLDMASYARIALRDRCSLRQAATCDTEWDGEPLDAL